MPTLNPLQVGDISYPEFAITTTLPISADLPIVKGTIYTIDAAGNLIAVTDTVVKGIFQASTKAPTNATAGSNLVQCLCQRSRILMSAPAGIVRGDSINLTAGGKAITAGAKASVNYIGTVFELYTKPDTGVTKKVTELNDLVVIDLAGI